MNASSQRGSAIIMLFIAVALFGALAYAFMQGSRGSTSMMTGEAAKATAYQSQDCSNAVNMAVKRLQMRGCGNLISTASDGSNTSPDAPTDGSCAVYHPNGGGVKSCGLATNPADPCTIGPIPTACADGAFYIGTVGGNRIYASPIEDAPTTLMKTTATATPGTNSTTDGLANTSAMIAAGAAAHPAAQVCNSKPPTGIWYVPALDEWNLMWVNRVAIDLASKNI